MNSSADTSQERGGLVGVIRRAVLAVGHHDLAAPIRRSSVVADRLLYRIGGGRWTITAVSRIPSLTLLVTNARGEGVVVPLQYLAIDSDLYIVGTNWSRPNHPLWSSWLMKRPQCRVNIGGRESSRTAILMLGEDRDRVWARILREAPYQANCERKANRQPRVFRLDESITGAN
ncbi:nitroreductase/quinone reductase family protein [Mycobacteroides abscessus]|uniref:nitroreductase/quinone reductase family protein n=1 Tax=Mycobacteroides abscessus TaxID=36809 RepID=UPI000C2603B7|nr:nitroreductase/quinone reductase family protein [Mycobacteroides abscessus]RIR15835.1 DUF385 domain-containing protein [Mycobacteroides abscessus]RIR81046.1 DUF385 domain-containing protein [Mycobacteroides abscessus]RIR95649.1 DUF385 domain-containing protein [Mycobacteroides abscessus]